jgi:hypothetical protein
MGAEMDADGCAVATGPAANHGRESPPAGAQAATDVRRESKIVEEREGPSSTERSLAWLG